jgi:hypothetical protein
MKATILLLFLLHFSNLNAQVIEQFKHKGQDAEIILLPSDYVLPDSCTYVGKLKSGDPYLASSPTFKPTYKNQLHVICSDAMLAGANVIQITHCTNVKWRNEFNLKGKAYKVNNYEAFKKNILEKKRAETQQMKDHAEVIIYRPNYTQSLNDLKSFKLCINNDTLQVVKNSKFRVKINKEGTTTIYAIGTKASQTLEIKFGQTYYICAYVYVPNAGPVQANKVSVPLTGYTPRIETVEPDKGEIESSFLKYTP